MLNRLHICIQKLIYLFLILSIVGCISPVAPDTVKEGVSLERAQELLPFQICLPQYIPSGINMNETMRYHDEFGDSNESDVTIDYFGGDKENPLFTIYERYGPGVRSDFNDRNTQRISMRRLIAWQADWKSLENFEGQIDRLDKDGVVEYQIYTFGLEKLIVEIKSPEDLKAVLITWKLSETVLIDIYSHLPLEETKLIANSISNCNY